jgi:hypothetical protein
MIKYALLFILVIVATNRMAASLYNGDDDGSMDSDFALRELTGLLRAKRSCRAINSFCYGLSSNECCSGLFCNRKLAPPTNPESRDLEPIGRCDGTRARSGKNPPPPPSGSGKGDHNMISVKVCCVNI